MSLEFTSPIANVLSSIEVNVDNTVMAADPLYFPGAVGLVVEAVNGVVVSNRADLREELQNALARDPNGANGYVKLIMSPSRTVCLGNAVGAPPLVAGDIAVPHLEVSQSPNGTKKDEFDLDSDDDVQEGQHVVKVKTQLGGPKIDITSIERAEDVLTDAAARIQPGKCIILLCDGFNPAVQVETAAQRHRANVMHIDPVARIKTRQRLEEYGSTLRKSIEKGVWVFIENATKSITLLEKLSESVKEVEAAGKMNPSTRIILMCEPHPHFPVQLLEGSITLKLKPSASAKADVSVEEAMSESRSKLTLLKCQSESLSVSQQPPTTSSKKRRVKLATEVDVVRLESSAFLEMSASAIPSTNDSERNDGNSGIERVARFRFGPNEKMISLCRVADDRFAVGTSSGYVVVLDRNGLPMIQYRPHKACIWDVAFASNYDFSTASEDGTSSVFRYDLAEQELEAASVASFQSDVFAVAYARDNDPSSAVLSGGLSATVCVLHSDRKSSSFIPATTSIQALCSIPARGHVLVGGGNGAITILDPDACKAVETSPKHVRKVPAVAAHGSTLITGSFDKTLRVWDYRAGLHCSHNLVMADVLTATAISDTHAAACSGSNLFLWDLRMLHQVLAVKNKAWNGLTRGLVLDGNMLVTASVDGAARFWQFK